MAYTKYIYEMCHDVKRLFVLINIWIEHKGMTKNHDFGYSLPPPKKREKKKRRMNSKNRDFK